MPQDLERLTAIDKKVSIARNIGVTSLIFILLIGILGFAGYTGYTTYKEKKDKEHAAQIVLEAKQKAEKEEADKKAAEENIKKNLATVKSKGDTADFGNFTLTLLDTKFLKKYPASNDGYFPRPERNAVGLKFTFKNTSQTQQTWHRATLGGLATTDNPHLVVEDFPLNSDLIKDTGDTNTNTEISIRGGEEFTGWIVVEVPTKITNPVFIYSSGGDLDAGWKFNW